MVQPRVFLSTFAAVVMLIAADGRAQTPQKNDSLVNGIVNGALAGGGAAYAFVKISLARCEPGCNEPDGPFAFKAALAGAAIGGTAGLFIDMARKQKPTSPSVNVGPMLSAKRKGIAVRLRW